jgi:hypothetical protein
MMQSTKLEHALQVLEEHRRQIKDLRDRIEQAQMVDITWLKVKYTYMIQDLNYRIDQLKGEIAEEQALEHVRRLREEKRNGSDAEERAAGSAGDE